MNRISMSWIGQTVFLASVLLAPVADADDHSWTLEKGLDPASYQEVNILWREADASISDEYGTQQVTPRLEWRCETGSDGKLQMRIDWRRFISSFNTPLTFVADDEDPMSITLGVDRSNKVTLIKKKDDTTALLQYLRGHARLAVTVTPYSDVPVTVLFDIAELAAGLERLSAGCNK